MKILGISPLDTDTTASLMVDGKIIFAAAEERYTRKKQQAGFPLQAVTEALQYANLTIDDIDVVAYPFMKTKGEMHCISKNKEALLAQGYRASPPCPTPYFPNPPTPVPGLANGNETVHKDLLRRIFYFFAGRPSAISHNLSRKGFEDWAYRSEQGFEKSERGLSEGLKTLGYEGPVKRVDHHRSHAANAFYSSNFERALIVTLDGYGTGKAGSVSLGENGKIKLLHQLPYPHSLGLMYEQATSALGFKPARHEGKIVGLAAYGDPKVLGEYILSQMTEKPGDFEFHRPNNPYFARYLSTKYRKIDIAAAFQWALEQVATRYIAHYVRETGINNVVLSGGVTANVKMNQRIYEIPEVESIFVYPNMGDGGCATGAAMILAAEEGDTPEFQDTYLGPSYNDEEIEAALKAANVSYEKSDNIPDAIATLINNGAVVARFGGRMEYGPRALGNRSILYHGRDPEVNNWLNKRLGRTEFMPFAPVALMEERNKYFMNSDGVLRTGEFMTVTLDCTDAMKKDCPAAVHIDGTARPQLITEERNAEYYNILKCYRDKTGIGTLINTSFNMHEEPIVRTPEDAVKAFLAGGLDVLAIGSFIVKKSD